MNYDEFFRHVGAFLCFGGLLAIMCALLNAWFNPKKKSKNTQEPTAEELLYWENRKAVVMQIARDELANRAQARVQVHIEIPEDRLRLRRIDLN